MSWQREFDRARRNGNTTVSKNRVRPIPAGFERISQPLSNMIDVYERQRGNETIRVIELPGYYLITAHSSIQQGSSIPETKGNVGSSLNIDAGTLGKATAAVAGIALVGKAIESDQSVSPAPQRVFISHSWRYEGHFKDIKKLLDRAQGFEWYDHSVSSEKPIDAQLPNHLRKKLRDQIRPTSIVVVLSGMYVSHSTWMREEIKIATDMKKPVLGVIPPNNELIPNVVEENATELVDFDGDTILDAISRHSQ